MIKQIKFRDTESGLVHGGILLENGGIICACCGGYIEEDDVGDIGDGSIAEIIEVYDDWIDFSEFIIEE